MAGKTAAPVGEEEGDALAPQFAPIDQEVREISSLTGCNRQRVLEEEQSVGYLAAHTPLPELRLDAARLAVIDNALASQDTQLPHNSPRLTA